VHSEGLHSRYSQRISLGRANVLRRTDVTGDRREEHSEGLHSRYSSENIIRMSKCPQENGCNRREERGA
jgi:hypothetical protein